LPEADLPSAIEVIGQVGKKAAVPKLLMMLETKPVFRWEIRNGLTTIGGQRAFNGLRRILCDKKQLPKTRFEACHALAHQGQEVDPPVFFPIVIDKTNSLRARR
jgi:hypothetical protein